MITMHFVEQGSDQWKIDRVGNYTGSNSDKLLGSFGATEYAKAVEDSFKGNFWTKRGHVLEDQAVELYEAITGTKILRDENGIKVGYITNSKYPKSLYSPDGVPPISILEIKCFDIPQHLQLINAKREDDLPLKIRSQVHYGLTISEQPYAHLVPYNPIFSKKKLDDGSDNPYYDPIKAFKIITIKANKNIQSNFKRILSHAM